MFRVRLASGEEAVYRTVEELALGIQSGVISADAMVFSATSGEWLPIVAHPEYSAAQERAATIVATEDPDELAPLPTVGELIRGGTVPVYQMVSQSAREIAARKRPPWLLPTATAATGLILLIGASLALLPRSESAEEAARPHDSVRAAHPVAAGGPAAYSRDLKLQPYNLALRLAKAGADLSASFTDSVRALALGDLLAPSRLASQDSVTALQEKLRAFRVLRADYRTRAITLETAYQDSASQLGASGAWSRADMTEWRARFIHLENEASSMRTETLLRTLEDLYALLNAERALLVIWGDRVTFQRPEARASYDRLRLTLVNYASLTPSDGERFPVPLSLLVQGLKRSTLPLTTG